MSHACVAHVHILNIATMHIQVWKLLNMHMYDNCYTFVQQILNSKDAHYKIRTLLHVPREWYTFKISNLQNPVLQLNCMLCQTCNNHIDTHGIGSQTCP